MFKKNNNLSIIRQRPFFLNQKGSIELAVPDDPSVHTGDNENFTALITRHFPS